MINTVISNNRLHVANEADYQGSVNSYNNGLTKLLSRIFRVSSYVTVNNEIKCLNKKSYKKFLTSLDVQEPSKNFDEISCNFRSDLGLMRHNISTKLANKLGEKFIHAILANDIEKAKDLIGKGAQIDKYFWLRGSHGITFDHLTKGLPHCDISPYVHFRLTPFIHVVLNKDDCLKQLLEKYQANEELNGECCEFERKIEGVNYQTNVQTFHNPYGYTGTDISTTQYTRGRDFYRKWVNITYDPTVKTNVFTNGKPDFSESWTVSSGTPHSGVQLATNALWLGATVANAFAGARR